MIQKFVASAIVAGGLTAANVALAQQGSGTPGHDGPYIGLYAGAGVLEDADNTGGPFVTGFPGTSIAFETDIGYVLGGVIGYALSRSGWDIRLEFDLSYRQNDIDKLKASSDGGLGSLLGTGSLNGVSTSAIDGDANVFAGLVNAWFGMQTGTAIVPYIGGGVGLANVSIDDLKIDGVINGVTVNNVQLTDDSDTVFAWQVGAGVVWTLTPRIALSIDYRWFNTDDPKFNFDPTGSGFESEHSSHNVLAGIRYVF